MRCAPTPHDRLGEAPATGARRPSAPPRALQVSVLLWMVAIASGIAETILAVPQRAAEGGGDGLLAGSAIRMLVLVTMAFVVAELIDGHRSARSLLAVVLGGLTLASLSGPLAWLLGGDPIGAAIADASIAELVTALFRAVHLGATAAAIVAMYRPAANRFFTLPH
ncbi:MAG: hypothetical protein S0880_16825 [Actinomycetota bacterium]|nr:hypothetical protein [Actinomycetota bacterium]